MKGVNFKKKFNNNVKIAFLFLNYVTYLDNLFNFLCSRSQAYLKLS